VIPSTVMSGSLHGTERRIRRGLVLLGFACVVGTSTLIACYSEGTDSTDVDPLATTGVYVPAEAAAQNPVYPGVTPGTPGKDPPEPAKDSGSTTPTDSGTTPKPPDSGTPDAT
jgi:hypothetical protein